MDRTDIELRSGEERVAGWLYRPDGPGPHGCVVMAHGFAGTRDAGLEGFAERFAGEGMAVLLFDYRHFGASEGESRQLVNVGRQLADWRAAIAHARGLDGVDPKRVALWGTSFSGGHVVALAAKDPEIAAVVSQGPFTSGFSALRAGTPKGALRLTVAGIRDQVGALLGRAPAYIPAVGKPGTLAAMTREEAYPGFHGIDPPESAWRNEFAPRAMLGLLAYRPYSKLAKVRCPVLVCVCNRDQTTPPEPAARAAERSPNSELIRYDLGHFEIYVDGGFERSSEDQAEFLMRNLLGAPAAHPAAAAQA